VQIDDKPHLMVAMTTDLDAFFGALALFGGGGDAKLPDAVNIRQDANDVFGDSFVRSLGAGAQLVAADSFHTNTSSSPDNGVLVLATADKLSLIGQSEWDCDHHRSIAQEPYVAIAPDYGAYDRITGYIKRIVQPLGLTAAIRKSLSPAPTGAGTPPRRPIGGQAHEDRLTADRYRAVAQ